MLISTPFLKSGITEDNLDSIQLAFTGQYPITSHLEWHNGQHLIAPQEGGTYVDVRAIADGKVVYSVKPDAGPSNDKDHSQNYAAFGAGPEWTDKGLVIIEHTTEIGSDGSTPTKITFYSVYAHLKELATGIAKDKKIYRKDILGKPGQIYGQPGHIHFEICLDDTNIKLLLGLDPKDWPAADAKPTKDGRTDVVFGSTYVYLPANTAVQTAVPTSHLRGTASQTLNAPQWVQLNYAGNATITSYKLDGSTIGERTDGDAEYDMYKEANTRHNSLSTGYKASSSPSGWYELLRFGRNLGRGSAATDKDPLPANAAHWRKINTPEGERWADLNADGTFKFSDADFPAILGWNCYGDDTKIADQRCDSPKLKALLTSEIDNADAKLAALGDPLLMFAYTRRDSIKEKLRKAICKFPTEFDQGDFEARYGHIKEEEYFKTDATGKNWKKLSDHIKALTVTDLPDAYKQAQWHLHPLAFIEVMRKCAWIRKLDLKRIFTTISDEYLETILFELNRFSSKHFLNTGLRQAHFFGQVRKETGPSMSATTESLNYSKSALISTFHHYYENRPLEATQDGRTASHAARQDIIANKVYAGQIGNGNTASGDGWKYRGRGLKQVTGKGNYQEFRNKYKTYWATGFQDFEDQPDLLVQMPYALRSAVWFWVSKGCMKKADAGMRDSDVDAVTGIVNHGELGTPKAQERRVFAQGAYSILE